MQVGSPVARIQCPRLFFLIRLRVHGISYRLRTITMIGSCVLTFLALVKKYFIRLSLQRYAKKAHCCIFDAHVTLEIDAFVCGTI